ncbi:hypothetical protein L249_6544 [Ophiocordyceps polyrhachis-furcata BCC 54312]|uniref:Fungal N-terminal domain-containing protein n=1 Tax=Ophiocordyceps polyrhachis-furcata BCC 54312 TaxID=1330021 RepID=A0A367LLN9_9HYPO|nr:hypothetical protein L249_6544 [Ophiocordyceps polyrhachis-furcata BCC 54312]
MVERLSAATAMVGLVADGGRISETMMMMTSSSSPALTRALLEMKQCRSTVQVLFKALCQLEAGRLPFPERASWIAVEDVVASLTDCVLAVVELQAVLLGGEQKRRRTSLEGGGLKLEEREEQEQDEEEEEVDALCLRIHWQLVSMTLMASILKMRSAQADTSLRPPPRCKTLADVPALSLLPLPLTTDELGPGRDLYSAAVYARAVAPFASCPLT